MFPYGSQRTSRTPVKLKIKEESVSVLQKEAALKQRRWDFSLLIPGRNPAVDKTRLYIFSVSISVMIQ